MVHGQPYELDSAHRPSPPLGPHNVIPALARSGHKSHTPADAGQTLCAVEFPHLLERIPHAPQSKTDKSEYWIQHVRDPWSSPPCTTPFPSHAESSTCSGQSRTQLHMILTLGPMLQARAHTVGSGSGIWGSQTVPCGC